MIITKAEAMKAVINGITIQHAYKSNPDILIDSFGLTPCSLLQKLESIDNTNECRVQFRIKLKTKSIQYRNYLMKNFSKYYVDCWDGTGCTQTEVENCLYFVKWLGDTVTVEAEI